MIFHTTAMQELDVHLILFFNDEAAEEPPNQGGDG